MKSRWTTYLLLAAVAAVWGIVAWRIFSSSSDAAPLPLPKQTAATTPAPEEDTLWLDYPDPFLKGAAASGVPVLSPIRALSAPNPAPARREKVTIVHAGTICAAGRSLYILTIGERQYELMCGDAAEEFRLTACDGDSLYLRKEGVTYGIKRCE